MAKITFTLEDTNDGVKIESLPDNELPEKFEDATDAQCLFIHLMKFIDEFNNEESSSCPHKH